AEDRITGGRNGFGAKLTNIFSKEFIVQCGDYVDLYLKDNSNDNKNNKGQNDNNNNNNNNNDENANQNNDNLDVSLSNEPADGTPTKNNNNNNNNNDEDEIVKIHEKQHRWEIVVSKSDGSPCGQFGSRKEGGKDASAARYIFTKLASSTRSIFNEYDDPI
nr:topoisomerase II - malaria parasite (Plasmodium falciparum) [Plasmodium falciparum]